MVIQARTIRVQRLLPRSFSLFVADGRQRLWSGLRSHCGRAVRQHRHQGAVQQHGQRSVEVPPSREQAREMALRVYCPHLLDRGLGRFPISSSDQHVDRACRRWVYPAVHLHVPTIPDDRVQDSTGRHAATGDLRPCDWTGSACRRRVQAMGARLQERTHVEHVRHDLLSWVLRHLHPGPVCCFY